MKKALVFSLLIAGGAMVFAQEKSKTPAKTKSETMQVQTVNPDGKGPVPVVDATKPNDNKTTPKESTAPQHVASPKASAAPARKASTKPVHVEPVKKVSNESETKK